LDYALPPELIAQHPLPERGASRLLHARAAEGRYADRRFAELPELLPPGTLIVLNDSRVIPARLYGTRELVEAPRRRRAATAEGNAAAADEQHAEERDSGAAPVQGSEAGPVQGGGRVELLYLRYLGGGVIEAVVGSNARLRAGAVVLLPAEWRAELLAPKARDGVPVRLSTPAGAAPELHEVLAYLHEHGLAPLPPYIKRDAPSAASRPDADAMRDKQRYQTVYAREDGSAAAPTAGLHFDAAMLEQLAGEGHTLARVALHIGLGTFAPVRAADLRDHAMHEEAYSVAADVTGAYLRARAAGRPVLAVGTTSLRVLHTIQGLGPEEEGLGPEEEGQGEVGAAFSRPQDGGNMPPLPLGVGAAFSRPQDGGNMPPPTGMAGRTSAAPTQHATGGRMPPLPGAARCGMTSAFIYPGQGTDACDLLLTNFHLPRSTLLALVYAFGGEELMRAVYHHAVEQRYRFYSYGDCMLIDRRGAAL
jgi:S-adenosylmethionine:tRNA ribosyltransferase-isomerase